MTHPPAVSIVSSGGFSVKESTRVSRAVSYVIATIRRSTASTTLRRGGRTRSLAGRPVERTTRRAAHPHRVVLCHGNRSILQVLAARRNVREGGRHRG